MEKRRGFTAHLRGMLKCLAGVCRAKLITKPHGGGTERRRKLELKLPLGLNR